MSFLTTVAACVMVWAALVAAAQQLWIIDAVGLAMLAVFITDVSVKILQNLTNKEKIKHRKGKAVLITGCDTGFGKLLSERLDRLGFKVYACCLQSDGDGARSLKESAVSGLKVLKMNVTSDEDLAQAASFIKQDLGDDKLWCVVNNAAIPELSEVEFCPISRYQQVFDINTLGQLRVIKTFLPMIREAGQGRIVIVASLFGRFTFFGFTAYSMSKHALISLADGLRQEMGKWNISVHTVEPGLYKTNISNSAIIVNLANKSWEATSEDIRRSYGEAYMEDFRGTITRIAENGKPAERIHEVVDDMVHAVAAIKPKVRYVPSMYTQFRARILGSLSTEMVNTIFLKAAVKAIPADLIERRSYQK